MIPQRKQKKTRKEVPCPDCRYKKHGHREKRGSYGGVCRECHGEGMKGTRYCSECAGSGCCPTCDGTGVILGGTT